MSVCYHIFSSSLPTLSASCNKIVRHLSASDCKMTSRKVLIVNKTYPTSGLELLKKNGLEPTVLPFMDHYTNAEAEITKSLGGFDALIWNTKFKLTEERLNLAGPQLKAISTMSSGLDHIDLGAVQKRGLPLGQVVKVLDDAVADITVGLLIAAARRFKEGVQMVENGDWQTGVQWALLGQNITGSTVGIVGFGGIGQAVARRLRGFDVARFLYSGRSDKPEAKALGAERVPLEQLLKESDHVILCCPLTSETKHLINGHSLKLMKRTAVLVNIGRGDLIDQEALITALKENTIFAAGLDVTTPEPIPRDHPLVSLPNCYVVPHLGSATVQTRDSMACTAAANIISALDGKPMQCPVFP